MPVSIPPFSEVPAPGDDVKSAWAQQLTQYAVDHVNDSVDAHDASAISYAATGTVVGTDVQSAITEVAAEKLAKAGDTMTGTLIVPKASIDATTPTLLFNETDQAVDARKWRWVVTAGQALLQSVNDAESAQMTAIGVTRAGAITLNGTGVTSVSVPAPTASGHAATRGYVDVIDGLKVAKTGDTMSGPLIIPAITAAGQAAQVTAFDAAVGQLAIGGVEMGDTGWRDVSSLLRTGLAKMTGSSPGVARMRRLGNVIHFNFHLNVTAGSITSLFTASLPSGWGANLDGAASTFLNSATPSYTSTSNNVNTPTTANHTFVSATAMGFSIALPNPGTVTWQGSYSAVAAWPTAVIGTALP